MVRIKVDDLHRRWLRRALVEHIKNNIKSIEPKLKQDMVSPYVNFFVSSSTYPLLSLGPVLSLSSKFKLKELYDLSYPEVISTLSLTTFARKFSSPSKENEFMYLSMSIKPIDIEAHFSSRPKLHVSFSSISPPLGIRAVLRSFKEQESPKIPRKVYSLAEEKIKARTALEELYSRNYDEYYLSNLLSAGVLGENKKIVPTRWAITAVDSLLSEFNVDIIRDFKELENVRIFHAEHFSNKFVVLLIPGSFEFENFEAWAPSTTWASSSSFHITEEYQGIRGRKSYPHSQAGAYYAVLFAISEFLRKIRRQAKAIVFREVSPGYQVPLGVWHVRETVRKALENEVFRGDLKEAKLKLEQLLTLPFPLYLKKSKILGQKRITDY